MTMEERNIKLRMSRALLETLFTRDEYGNRLSLELGDPDADGFYAPTITTHYDDNLVNELSERHRKALRALGTKKDDEIDRLNEIIGAAGIEPGDFGG